MPRTQYSVPMEFRRYFTTFSVGAGGKFCDPSKWGTLSEGGAIPSSPLENEVFKPFFQPANHGKISAISLQLCESFCVIHIIAYKPPTTTTRQNRGNISAISLQLWECFCESHCAYTTTQPGQIVGIFPRFRCSCENISAIRAMLTQPRSSVAGELS